MEDDLKTKMEDNLKKKWKMTSKKIEMEDDLKKNKNGRQPKKIKWKTNQSTKINLIGSDTIVNSQPNSISTIVGSD